MMSKNIKIGELDIYSFVEDKIIEDVVKCTKIEQALFEKYVKEIVVEDLKKIGFKNISFEWYSNIDSFSGYNIFADYELKEDEYKNFLDYYIFLKKDNRLQIDRECEKYFTDILKIEEDKTWNIEI